MVSNVALLRHPKQPPSPTFFPMKETWNTAWRHLGFMPRVGNKYFVDCHFQTHIMVLLHFQMTFRVSKEWRKTKVFQWFIWQFETPEDTNSKARGKMKPSYLVAIPDTPNIPCSFCSFLLAFAVLHCTCHHVPNRDHRVHRYTSNNYWITTLLCHSMEIEPLWTELPSMTQKGTRFYVAHNINY